MYVFLIKMTIFFKKTAVFSYEVENKNEENEKKKIGAYTQCRMESNISQKFD